MECEQTEGVLQSKHLGENKILLTDAFLVTDKLVEQSNMVPIATFALRSIIMVMYRPTKRFSISILKII